MMRTRAKLILMGGDSLAWKLIRFDSIRFDCSYVYIEPCFKTAHPHCCVNHMETDVTRMKINLFAFFYYHDLCLYDLDTFGSTCITNQWTQIIIHTHHMHASNAANELPIRNTVLNTPILSKYNIIASKWAKERTIRCNVFIEIEKKW